MKPNTCENEKRFFLSHEQVCYRITDPRTDVALTINDRAAICVRHVSVSGALQFAVFHAVSSVLHRNASQVIHCSELYVNNFFLLFTRNARVVENSKRDKSHDDRPRRVCRDPRRRRRRSSPRLLHSFEQRKSHIER